MPIRLFGDPVLRQKCEPVAVFGEDVKGIINDLIDSVSQAEGLGLAAPQIGALKRVIVVVEPTAAEKKYFPLVNPEIVSACGEQFEEEGCLSVPGIYEKVRRPQSVVVKGLDREGKEVSMEASGLMARAFCHEIDHLDGVVFVDRIGMVKRGLLKGKLGGIKKQAKELLRSLK